MFDETSRYAKLEIRSHVLPDGRETAYVARRFLPPGESLPLMAEVKVQQGERLDHVTARLLGDPAQFWRVADANDALRPAELTAAPGRYLRIPLPQP